MKPIVLLTSGTRGDVQPAIALALGLQRSGLPVRLAAPPAFQAWIELFGLPFAPIDGNPSELLTRPGGQSALTYDGHPLRNLRTTLAFIEDARPLYNRMLESAWEVCRHARALLVSLPTAWGVHIAEALNIPCLGAFLQPVTPTRAFPVPLFPFPMNLGGGYNRWTYAAAGMAIWLPWRSILNRFRAQTLGLPPLGWSGPRPLPFGHLETFIYGFSPRLVPKPDDWPPNSHITGFWSLPSKPFVPSAGLQDFLRAGPAPVYIGFGSPGVHKPQDVLNIILQGIETAGIRAVVGLTGVESDDLPDTAHLLLEATPHDWLFPRMAGIVHHGGAGTTAAGLLAGRPSLLIPLATDQFFWGRRIWELGLGPAPIPRQKLTSRRLGMALRQLVDEPDMQKRAQAFGQALLVEDGVKQAVAVLRQYI